MISNLKIEHRIARDNLGETDDAYAAEYVQALRSALRAEYPQATVKVNLNSDFCNECQTFVNGDEDEEPENAGDFVFSIEENVNTIANLVWERMD